MLVLSRKVGERIWIGNEICVTVVRLTSGGVRLGIEAPGELPVIREELKVRQAEDSAPPEFSANELSGSQPEHPLPTNLANQGSVIDSRAQTLPPPRG